MNTAVNGFLMQWFSGLKNDRHAAHPGNLTRSPCRLTTSVQLELRNTSQKFLYHDLGFDSKNMCTEATMNAGSKAQVFVRTAISDERVGIWKCARIAIGYRQHQQHLLPGFHWHA